MSDNQQRELKCPLKPDDLEVTNIYTPRTVQTKDGLYKLSRIEHKIGYSLYSFAWDNKEVYLDVEWMPVEGEQVRNLIINYIRVPNGSKVFNNLDEAKNTLYIIACLLRYFSCDSADDCQADKVELNLKLVDHLISGSHDPKKLLPA